MSVGFFARTAAILSVALSTSCATDRYAGCERTGELDGYVVYSCAHPFAARRGVHACAYSTLEASSGHGPLLPCGWTRAYTDRWRREVFVWEQTPEALEHERLHVLGLISDDD